LGRSGPATGMVDAESGATTDIYKRRLHLALLPLQSSTVVVGSDLSLPGGASDARQFTEKQACTPRRGEC
jgi:hypothetical protein